MASIKDRYPQSSPYLRAADVEMGDLTLTISGVHLDETVGTKQCDILTFSNYNSQLILSSITANQIARLLGDNTDTWPGKTIALFYCPDVFYQGKKVGGIRVKAATPQGNGTAVVAKPEIDDCVPF
jgi:hypothetical protein